MNDDIWQAQLRLYLIDSCCHSCRIPNIQLKRKKQLLIENVKSWFIGSQC